MDKVSIIIPVYNAEMYIVNCLNSIVEQRYKNIELIIVNDGSADRTSYLIERFIENKSDEINIKLIEKENGGVSSARNKGLSSATGKYIVFIDSDDTVSPEHVMSLISPLKDLSPNDLVCNSLIDEHQRVKNINLEGYYHLENFEKAYDVLESSNQLGYLHNKIFSRDIIIGNNIVFNEKISMAEDLLFVLEYIKFIDGFFFSKVSSYQYTKNEGSLSEKNLTDSQIMTYLEILKSTYNKLFISMEGRGNITNNINFYYGLKKTTCLMSIYVYRAVKGMDSTKVIKKKINNSLTFKQLLALKKINAIKYLILTLPQFVALTLIKTLYINKYR